MGDNDGLFESAHSEDSEVQHSREINARSLLRLCLDVVDEQHGVRQGHSQRDEQRNIRESHIKHDELKRTLMSLCAEFNTNPDGLGEKEKQLLCETLEAAPNNKLADVAGVLLGTLAKCTRHESASVLSHTVSMKLLRLLCSRSTLDEKAQKDCVEALLSYLDDTTESHAEELCNFALNECIGASTEDHWDIHKGKPLAIVPKCISEAERDCARRGKAPALSPPPCELYKTVETRLIDCEWPNPGLVKIAELIKDMIQGRPRNPRTEELVGKAIKGIDYCFDNLDLYLVELHGIAIGNKQYREQVMKGIITVINTREVRFSSTCSSQSRARHKKLNDSEQFFLEAVLFTAAQDESYAKDVFNAVRDSIDPVHQFPFSIAVMLVIARQPRYEKEAFGKLLKILINREKLFGQVASAPSSPAAATAAAIEEERDNIEDASTMKCMEDFAKQCCSGVWALVLQELIQFAYNAINESPRNSHDREFAVRLGKMIIRTLLEYKSFYRLCCSVISEACDNIAIARGDPDDWIEILELSAKHLKGKGSLSDSTQNRDQLLLSIAKVVHSIPDLSGYSVAHFIRAIQPILQRDSMPMEIMIALQKALLGGEKTAICAISGLCELLKQQAKLYDEDSDETDDDMDGILDDVPSSSQGSIKRRVNPPERNFASDEIFSLLSRATRLKGSVREFLYVSIAQLVESTPLFIDVAKQLLMKQLTASCRTDVDDGDLPFNLSNLVQNDTILEPLPCLIRSLHRVSVNDVSGDIGKFLRDVAEKTNKCASVLDAPSARSSESETEKRLSMAQNIILALIEFICAISERGTIKEEDARLILELYSKYHSLEERAKSGKKGGKKKKTDDDDVDVDDGAAAAPKKGRTKLSDCDGCLMTANALIPLLHNMFVPEVNRKASGRLLFDNDGFRVFVLKCCLKRLTPSENIAHFAGYKKDDDMFAFGDCGTSAFAQESCRVLVSFYYVPFVLYSMGSDSGVSFEREQQWSDLDSVNKCVCEALRSSKDRDQPRASTDQLKRFLLEPCNMSSGLDSDATVIDRAFKVLEKVVLCCVKLSKTKCVSRVWASLEDIAERMSQESKRECVPRLKKLAEEENLLQDKAAVKQASYLYMLMTVSVDPDLRVVEEIARDVRGLLGDIVGLSQFRHAQLTKIVNDKNKQEIAAAMIQLFDYCVAKMRILQAKEKESSLRFTDVVKYCQDACVSIERLMKWSKHIVHSKVPLSLLSPLLAVLQRLFDLLASQISFYQEKLAVELASRNGKGKKKGKPAKKKRRTGEASATSDATSDEDDDDDDDDDGMDDGSGRRKFPDLKAAMKDALTNMYESCGRFWTNSDQFLEYVGQQRRTSSMAEAMLKFYEATKKLSRTLGTKLDEKLPDIKDRDFRMKDH